jgi:hypothetical protein
MTNEVAVRKMEQYFEGALLNREVVEAWQTLKAAVLAQQTNNSVSAPCEICKYSKDKQQR